MRQNAQKQSQKFCRSKEDKNGETHPVWAEKGETGCVLGAGESSSGWRRMKLGEKIRSPNQSEHYNHATRAKRKPAKTQCFRRFCGRGRRTWSRLPPRSVRGRAPLALAHPSARGFGVDVGERTREREKADVIRFPPQAPERPVLVWCCELFLEKDCVSTTTSSFERKAPPPGGWPS